MGRQSWSKRSLILGSGFYSSNYCQESHMDERLGYSPPLLPTSRNILTLVNNSFPIFCPLWEFLRRCEYIMPMLPSSKKVALIKLATAWDYIWIVMKDLLVSFTWLCIGSMLHWNQPCMLKRKIPSACGSVQPRLERVPLNCFPFDELWYVTFSAIAGKKRHGRHWRKQSHSKILKLHHVTYTVYLEHRS